MIEVVKGLGEGEVVNFEFRNQLYLEFSVPLAVEASTKAIAMWGGSKDDITHVVGITCTGTIVPGIEFHVIEKLGLRPSTQRLSVSLMGCFGGCSGLKVASAIAAQNPSHRVLVVCCELCSLQCQVQKFDMDQLVASMLFGDGSGAIVVGAGLRGGETPKFEFLRSASSIIPNTLPLMGWELGMDGWKVTLSPQITKHLGDTICEFADSITESTLGRKVEYADMAWPIHPGGMAIIEAIEMACKLDSDVHTSSTRGVLKRVGNMSSGTVYFVLEDLVQRKTDKEFALMASFGPGLTTEGNLLRVCPAASSRN